MKIPEIERREPGPGYLEITLYLDPDLLWFKGHFAVQPLLPGVAQLDRVMHYAAALPPGYRFHSIQNVKFAARCYRRTRSRCSLPGSPNARC